MKPTIYREIRCNGCHRTHMVTTEALQDPKLTKRCPHCGGKRQRATGQVGIPTTQQAIQQAAKERGQCISCLGDPTGVLRHKDFEISFPFCRTCADGKLYNAELFDYDETGKTPE